MSERPLKERLAGLGKIMPTAQEALERIEKLETYNKKVVAELKKWTWEETWSTWEEK